MAHEFEARMAVQVVDVALGAGEEIVDAEDFVSFRQQAVGQMRAQEPGASGDEDALAAVVKTGHPRAFSCFVDLARPLRQQQ